LNQEDVLKAEFKKFVKAKGIYIDPKDEAKNVNEDVFAKFMFYLGFDDKFRTDIEKYFHHFAENLGSFKIPSLKISIKSFLFNHKKYMIDKYKIRYVLSDKAAK